MFPIRAQLKPGAQIPLFTYGTSTKQYASTNLFAYADESGRTVSAEITELGTYVVGLPHDQIQSTITLNPNSGVAGTIVNLSGNGFSANPTEDVVTFAGTSSPSLPAKVIAASPTLLTIVVPEGAVTGSVMVRTATQTWFGALFTVGSNSPVPPPMPPVVPPVLPSAAKLTWRPPTCGDATYSCTDLYLTNTGSHQNPVLNSNTDYRLHLPTNGPLVGGLTISGSHNVQIIGGEIDLTVPCSDSTLDCQAIKIWRGSSTGQVYIEGVYIKNPDPNYLTDTLGTGDGIDVDDYPGITDVTLQNVRIEGIKGCDSNNHADVFQPYNAGGAVLNVDQLTGTTDCQGMQIDPDYAYSHYGLMPKSGVFKNVNINVFANPALGNGNRYAWWLTYGTSACVTYPITLTNVYVNEPEGTLSHDAVWPDPSSTGTLWQIAGCLGIWSNNQVSWLGLSKITGVIQNGLPPGGDYVPVGRAGIGYVSPGYQ